jgi:hypothetical protein
LAESRRSRGISGNKLMEASGTAPLTADDTETRFRLMANSGDRHVALDILARLEA